MNNFWLHHRKSIRLKNYDYSCFGFYFVTICTYNRELLFGDIVNGKMILNDLGKIVNKSWLKIPAHFPNVELDEFVIMPNHIHGIIVINPNPRFVGVTGYNGATARVAPTNISPIIVGAGLAPAQQQVAPAQQQVAPAQQNAPALGDIIGAYKSICFKEWRDYVYHNNLNTNNLVLKFWQRNYFEHIIRNDKSLNRIREYIYYNPVQWKSDRNNPKNFRNGIY